jgi:hypothetical protein
MQVCGDPLPLLQAVPVQQQQKQQLPLVSDTVCRPYLLGQV